MNAAPPYQPLIRLVGLDAEAVFTHPDVTVWRDLPDRQNATLDFTDTDGRLHRWHVKRYPAKYAKQADAEVRGLHLLRQAGIRTPDLVAHGTLPDGRSFLITDDLAGHRPAEKFLAAGGDFAAILPGTAAVAARLHHAGLHHRDLYLNHFFIDAADPAREPALIDAARVRELPRFLTQRWVVKDLAQFWYSGQRHGVAGPLLDAWLAAYAHARSLPATANLADAVRRKAARIARHDARLTARTPARHAGLPGE